MFLGRCEYCGQAVTSDQRAAYRVRGWEFERGGGGANRIAGKERQPNRVCHVSCVELELRRKRLGLEGQMSL